MSADLMQWAWEIALWASVAILLVVPLRWMLGRLFGVRVSILSWMLVPLVCVATMLPPRTVENSVRVEVGTATPVSPASTDSVAAPTKARIEPRMASSAVAAAWTAGVLAWLLVFGMRQRALGQRIGIRRCSGRICVSDASRIGPMVVGVFRPRVILPADFRSRFRRPQRRLVLAHELTHIRRRDPLWNLVAATFQCLLWFNPLVHWAASRFRRDQELACDAAVLESRSGAKREYAGALLQLDHPPSFGLPAFGGHPLKERITMLTRISSHSSNRRRLGASVAALLALGIGFAAWAADTETRAADEDGMFSFDIEITVDGVREEGTLKVTGDETVVPIAAGEPFSLARKQLLLRHESEDSDWSAHIEVTRASDVTFWVTATISKNNKVVAASRNIMRSDAPLSIEQTDPDTDAGTYRIKITPVGGAAPAGDGASDESDSTLRSAQVVLTIDDNTVVKRIEWPMDVGAELRVPFSFAGPPQPWKARVVVERLDGNKVKLCIDHIELGDLATSSRCMMFDRSTQDNAYMMGGLGETGIPLRLDMIPNIHEGNGAQQP